MKLKPTLILLIALGPMIVCASVFSYIMTKQKDKIEEQDLRILFLIDYRNAYLEHFDSCHCHDNCFNWNNYMKRDSIKSVVKRELLTNKKQKP